VDILVAGAGDVASQYLAGLAEHPLSVAGVCDRDADRAATVAARHDAPAFTQLEDALDAVAAPLVLNLTSHGSHSAVTSESLAAGRHVYSEKPIALEAAAAGQLLDTAEASNLGLAVAPLTPEAPAQRLAGRMLASGRLGPVRLAYAHAHVGRVTEWHDRPGSFLAVGPLYDGGVYPLTLLVSWFGPVEAVRTADALDAWPERETRAPDGPSHVEATLDFEAGPTVRLTASFYAPHRSREFYGLELHGDDGSLYLADAGTDAVERETVQFGRLGRDYTPVPPQFPEQSWSRLDGVVSFAAALTAGRRPRATAKRGAHVVAVCEAIERAATTGDACAVDSWGATATPIPPPSVRPPSRPATAVDRQAIDLPPIGFGCSRYREGTYVDRTDSIATALDAGYRLLDVAELYGNEYRIGEILAAPGSPDRSSVFLLGKVWNTNHDHVLEACRGSRRELGIDAFDCYALHWPEAWSHQGELDRLAEKPVAEQERLTFPEEAERETDRTLADSWRALETVHERGWARTLGACNVSRSQLETILAAGTVDPALVQIERHPYRPQTDLVSFCHERGIRVVAHSPLSAPGLLTEPVVESIAADRSLSPAAVILAWNVTRGVVPIPSSNTPDHVVDNLAAAAVRLSAADCARLEDLRDPAFER
jgi:alcohol dehydrogenase (NADP+)